MSQYNIAQLRGAWGAGFAAAEKKAKSDSTLVGRYFHTVVNGEIDKQGKIISEPQEDCYEAHFFDWMTGAPTTRQVFRIEEMNDWLLYEARGEWLAAGERVW